MTITLERFKADSYATYGRIVCGGKVVTHTIEPPLAKLAVKDNASELLPEGVYEIEMRLNPNAGVPCLKIVGGKTGYGISLRSMRPLSPANQSPVCIKLDETTGKQINEHNVEGWMNVLRLVMDNERKVNLKIKTTPEIYKSE